jgi:hypothetical protein
MTETRATFRDKTDWPDGPRNGEPDRIEWRDATTAIPCLMVRNLVGVWCGYAAVPPGHPWHGVSCFDDEDGVLEQAHYAAHGGLTFSGLCMDGESPGRICHVPAAGEPDNVWWLGFDCAHAWDRMPAIEANDIKRGRESFLDADDIYRDEGYVRGRVAELAAAIEAARP